MMNDMDVRNTVIPNQSGILRLTGGDIYVQKFDYLTTSRKDALQQQSLESGFSV